MIDRPTVSICMITYNHQEYICDAIQGVFDQLCNFNLELVISNDCSIDLTEDKIQEILNNHPKSGCIKYINHDVNIGIIPNFYHALNECNGTFIALCDGDDFWTDPLKLQKQVDFLKANQDYIACCHNTYFINEATGIKKGVLYSQLDSRTISFSDLCPLRTFHTSSILFRNNILKKMDFNFMLKSVKSGDKYLFMHLWLKGMIFYDKCPMAVYRRNKGSASMSPVLNRYMDADIRMYDYFKKKVPEIYKDELEEAKNYFKVSRFNYELEKNKTFRLFSYYLALIPIAGKSKHLPHFQFKKATKAILNKILPGNG